MEVLDFDKLERLAGELAGEFAAAGPYPHVVIDDFLPQDVADGLVAEFEQSHHEWKHYHHYNERKMALTELEAMPERTRSVVEAMQSRRFVDIMERLSGLEDLVSDPDLEGAGMHLVEPGGFLNVHTDFLAHTKRRTWSRHINLLIYLNKDWQEEWNGNLELWEKDLSRCVHSIPPVFNRCVIFNTVENSFHGHPHKLSCPEGTARKSLLLYYYRDEGKELAVASTDYRALPDDSLTRRLLISADRMALRLYTLIKGRTGLSDRLMDRLLRKL